MSDFNTFHSRLKEAREKNGMKQRELAAKLMVSVQTISAYEREKLPTFENAVLIAETLHVSVDWLLGIEKPTGVAENYADVFLLVEALENALGCTVSVKKTRVEVDDPNPYSEVPRQFMDKYELSFFDFDQTLWNVLQTRSKLLALDTTPELRQEIYSVWRKGAMEELKKEPLGGNLPF